MGRNLALRVLAGGVALPALFLIISEGGLAYVLFLVLVVVIGAWEWWAMQVASGAHSSLPLLVLGSLGFLQGGWDTRPERLGVFLALFLVAVALDGLFHRDTRSLGATVFGALYVGLLPAFLLKTRGLPFGREAVIISYAVVFLCDTGAYAFGLLLGRHRLAPQVSPKKTWEGAVAGLIVAVVSAIGLSLWFGRFLSLWGAVSLGVAVGLLGQLGDLFESALKRAAGVKDSSRLIPGHGGVLDRFDNLHFVAPVLYLLFVAFGRP